MIKTLLRPVLPVVMAAALTGGGFFALGAWRRAGDTAWCKDVTAGAAVSPERLEAQRAACVVQRQRQRTMFGAIWRTNGQETATCGVELARLQLLDYGDTAGEAEILSRYGIDPAGFEVSERTSQDRFVQACLARNREAAR